VSLLWSLVLFVHITSAAFWVGGQLMLSVVVLPLLRKTARPEVVAQLASLSGRRFAKVSNFGLFPLLIVTGPLLAWHDGVRIGTLNASSFGRLLEIKILVVVAVLALAVFHGVAVRRLSRRSARRLAQVTVVLSVLILALAAGLAILPTP